MVWKPLMSYRWTLWANNSQTLILTDPNQRAITVKNQGIVEISVARLLKKQREETENNQNVHGTENSDANSSIPENNTNNNNHNNYKNSNRAERKPETVYPSCEICGKTNHSTERCYVRANAANRSLPWKSKPQQQDAQDSTIGCVRATTQHLN